MSTLIKIFYYVYLPFFAKRDSTVYVDPYRKWYAIYLSDIQCWEFRKGDYLK